MPDYPVFGVLLRERRQSAGLTQEELARAAKIGVRTVRNLETRWGVRPQRSTVDLLAGALGLAGAERAAFVAVARGRGRVEQAGGHPRRAGQPARDRSVTAQRAKPAPVRREEPRLAVAARWRRLDPGERLCLQWLAVIRGRWSLGLARAVLVADPAVLAGRDVTELVDRFVTLGLVGIRSTGRDRQFSISPAVRDFALARAAEAGTLSGAQVRRAALVSRLAADQTN